MKLEIANNGGMRIWLEVVPVTTLSGDHHLVKFYTKYDSSKDPDYERVHFKMILERDQLDKFVETLVQYNQ